jgi:hypothetical protein
MKHFPDVFTFKSIPSLETPREAYNFWLAALDNYNERRLTHQRDRLPAISGIARVNHDITKSKYIAGLWLDEILLGLTWRSVGLCSIADGANLFASASYHGPTFSWVSVDRISTPSCTDIDHWVPS